SVHSDGTEGDQDSSSPSISDDGRYVAFESQADNLIDGDTNLFPFSDIFVHDLQTGETTLVSVDSNGIQGNGDNTSPSISADGRYVAFTSDATNLVANDTNGNTDIFVHDLQTGATTRLSVDSSGTEGNGNSSAPAISANGQYVTFESDADNLVGGDGNGFFDIFVYEGDPLPSNPTQSQGNNSSGSGSCFIATAASDWADF
ncbi:MAG: calcium-binding protein, partial [Deltaproteobacteria bacterium]|nr:calcium-binding protein [Deltaproteobacteria bacterium]